jgi:hypothetical protein
LGVEIGKLSRTRFWKGIADNPSHSLIIKKEREKKKGMKAEERISVLMGIAGPIECTRLFDGPVKGLVESACGCGCAHTRTHKRGNGTMREASSKAQGVETENAYSKYKRASGGVGDDCVDRVDSHGAAAVIQRDARDTSARPAFKDYASLA